MVVLINIQSDIESLGNNDLLQDRELKAQNDLEVVLNLDEEFCKVKTKLNWQIFGDRNTEFFHTYARIKRKTNSISFLNINNNVVTNKRILENHI